MTTQQPIGFQNYSAGFGPLDPLSHAVHQRDAKIMDMVRQALDANRAVLAYQPIMHSKNTKQVAFFEGLMRLADENGRHIPAGEFIYAVEDTELGRRIDCLRPLHNDGIS